MKPSWNDAPEWANYLAMDSDGSWWWYAEEPTLDCGDWYPQPITNFDPVYADRKPTLEQRPKEKR